MLNILFLQKRSNKAGAQVCLIKTVRSLLNLGVNVKVVVGEEGWLAEELKKLNALACRVRFPTVRSIVSRLIYTRDFMKAIDRVNAQYGPFHIVNANDTWDSLIAEIVSKRLKIPWVVHLRSVVQDFRSHFYKYHCNRASAVVAVSQYRYDQVKDLEVKNLVYIPEGLNIEEIYDPEIKDIDFPYKVGIVGSDKPVKGWDDVAVAYSRIYKNKGRLPEKITFIGRTTEERKREILKILEDVKALEVEFLDHINNFTEAIKEFDLIVVPSREESYGMAMVESIASGVPILVSKTGIIPEIIEDDSFCTFKPGDVESFISCWENLDSWWNSRYNLLMKWQEKLRQNYIIDDLANRLIELYYKILNERGNSQ